MRKKILIFSTMFSLLLSFPVMAKPIYTANSSGGYDFYDPATGCSGHVSNAPITVGSDSGVNNSTVKSEGESNKTEKKDDVSTKNSSVSITGSSTDNSSVTGTNSGNTSVKTSDSNVKGNGNNAGSGTAGKDNVGSGTEGNNNAGSGTKDNVGSGTAGKDNVGSGTAGKDNVGSGTEGKDNVGSGTDNKANKEKITKDKFTNSIQKVELGKDGNLVIYSYDEEGNIVTETSNFTSGSTRYTYYTDEEGSTHKFSQKVSQSDDYIVEEEFLYFTWDMINMTNNQSKFYGNQVQVAKTTSDSAQVQPDLDGTYKIIGTPWYRRDYYKEITVEEEGDCDEFGNCDTDTYTERVLVDSKIVAKSSNQYMAKVPLYCDGCPVPVICVNGACDCATTLNAVCDEENAPNLIIKERVELEK